MTILAVFYNELKVEEHTRLGTMDTVEIADPGKRGVEESVG